MSKILLLPTACIYCVHTHIHTHTYIQIPHVCRIKISLFPATALCSCRDMKLQLQYDLHFAQCREMLHRSCSKHASSTFNETQAFRKSSVSCKACLQSVASASTVENNLWLSCESAPNPLCPWNALVGLCQVFCHFCLRSPSLGRV